MTDALTGLSNNRHFREWMDRETQRLGRFGGDLSLVLLDVDNFKSVNDTYGHLQGDEVLRALGRVLQLESRGIDEPARYGGEEFVLALPETPKGGAVEVAERIRERIAAHGGRRGGGQRRPSVTASIGVATMPEDGSDPQALIAAADEALYEAKRAGKNRRGRGAGHPGASELKARRGKPLHGELMRRSALDNAGAPSVTLQLTPMGILDDAIREHLELKRQHGADSDDVEKLEKEAFGPADAAPAIPSSTPPRSRRPPPADEGPRPARRPAEALPPDTGEGPMPSRPRHR